MKRDRGQHRSWGRRFARGREADPPFPHEGCCTGCWVEGRCNVCGEAFGSSAINDERCTNGRCRKCHDRVCTPGGAVGPGHGFGDPTRSTK